MLAEQGSLAILLALALDGRVGVKVRKAPRGGPAVQLRLSVGRDLKIFTRRLGADCSSAAALEELARTALDVIDTMRAATFDPQRQPSSDRTGPATPSAGNSLFAAIHRVLNDDAMPEAMINSAVHSG